MKKNKDIAQKENIKGSLVWKVNTGGLIREIIECTTEAPAIRTPLLIFRGILAKVGERAIEIDDPVLNGLMCRLAIYAESDPCNSLFNENLTNETITNGIQESNKQKNKSHE